MQVKIKIVIAITFYALLAGSVFLSGCVEKSMIGSAYFSSEPAGAQIWIDGVNTGKVTPATISNLKEGNHTYGLKKEGYIILNGPFYVKAGEISNIIEASIPSSTRISKISSAELKYHLLENIGKIFYCDPDIYPVVRAGAEEEHALEQFPDIQKNTEEFQAILRHTNLEGITTFSAEQKLIVYQEHKKLNAIFFELSGEAYRFQLRISDDKGKVFQIEGIIDYNRTITILKKEPSSGICPICLSGNTRIDTPTGPVAVKDLRNGMAVWTTDSSGNRIPAVILKNVTVAVPPGYRIVHLVLDDGRELFVSPGHPTSDGRRLGALTPGDILDGARVIIAEQVSYEGKATYDILPSGDTGFYWADGILIKSTLIS